MLACQLLDKIGTRVVPGAPVFITGVTQADDKFR